MKPRTLTWAWRSATAVKFAPVVIVVAVMAAQVNAQYLNNYWLDATTKATIAMIILAPACAGLAAWEAVKWRDASVVAGSARTRLHIAVFLLRPVAALAVAGLVVSALLNAARIIGTPGHPSLEVMATVSWVLLAHIAVGWLLGSVAPKSIAMALSAASSFVWLAYPPAFQPFWIRNVTGHLGTSCCDLDQELAPQALIAPAILATAVLGVAVIMLTTGFRGRAVGFVALPVLLFGVVLSALIVRDFGADPVVPRSAQMACSDKGSTRICLWPEHADHLSQVSGTLLEATERLVAAGLPQPRGLTEASKDGWWTFNATSSSRKNVRTSLAVGVLGDLPPACPEGQHWTGGHAYGPLTVWLTRVAGLSWDDARSLSDGRDARRVRDLLASSKHEQMAWYAEMSSAVQSCGRDE